ncbi:hypothetical protein Memar_0695 [Methanoculleus marisnigri JR1]|uniref:Uncharacterized protein n=1 Tax=Methanoculleus marisnigri (strain ATCC 35101 / DSM 1498 / JR1) TaxID=368407 RepID=A3CTC8_METMJ|nr:hypothetical protein Memar_0695 [Methanoculleus marisnigri JR1]
MSIASRVSWCNKAPNYPVTEISHVLLRTIRNFSFFFAQKLTCPSNKTTFISS